MYYVTPVVSCNVSVTIPSHWKLWGLETSWQKTKVVTPPVDLQRTVVLLSPFRKHLRSGFLKTGKSKKKRLFMEWFFSGTNWYSTSTHIPLITVWCRTGFSFHVSLSSTVWWKSRRIGNATCFGAREARPRAPQVDCLKLWHIPPSSMLRPILKDCELVGETSTGPGFNRI